MKKISFAIFTILFIACKSDDQVNTSFAQNRIVSIEHELNDKKWTEVFSYNDLEQLISIYNPYSFETTLNFEYEEELLIEIKSIAKGEDVAHEKHSLQYNSDDLITDYVIWSTYPDGDFSKAWTYEFFYNSNDQIKEQKTFFNRTGEYTGKSKYSWENDNIKKVENFELNDDKYENSYDVDFKYDNKRNFKSDYLFNFSSQNWSLNNVVETNFTDHSGRLDVKCDPCETTYTYYVNELPRTVNAESGEMLEIFYTD